MLQSSLFFDVNEHQLHLRHIANANNGQPILMIHGSIENGRIFYSDNNKGLACYLAEQGFDVYVLDFRGRGLSTPKIKENPNHGYFDSIMEDIPQAIEYIFNRTGKKVHVACHSWGGVLFHCSFLRFPAIQAKTVSVVCFGTKRQVTVWNLERLFKLSLFWRIVAPLITKRFGYLDAVKLKVGADAETHDSIRQSNVWLKKSPWLDPVDGFNYDAAAKTVEWPPTWHIAAIKDRVLGHPRDVKLFLSESNPNAKFTVLSVAAGNLLNYDHINMLTDKRAKKDHFPLICQWFQAY